MRVRAVKLGYYNLKRRKPEVEFDIRSEKEFSSRWMAKVEDEAASSKKSKKAVKEVDLPLVEEDVI